MMDFTELKQIKVSHFASSARQQTFLLQYGDRYFEVNARTAGLVQFLQQYDSQQEAVAAYQQLHADGRTQEELDKTVRVLLSRLHGGKRPGKPFLFKRELLSEETIAKLTPYLKGLFHPVCMWVVVCIALCLDGYFLLNAETLFQLTNGMDLYVIGGILLFLIASSLFHELGHATACRYFNVSHGGIGFGLYLNFPVFYTDVSKTWSLTRKQRCVVNLAGVYFQAYLLIAILFGYICTQNELLKYLVLVMNLGFVITLNPFFKFDGYWLMADWSGVANLRQRSNEVLKYVWIRFRKKQQPTFTPYLFRIRKREKIWMLVYTSVVNLFMGYYFFFLIPYFLVHFVDTFPQMIRQLAFDLSRGYEVDFHLVHQMLSQLLFLALTVYFFYKLLQPLFKWKRH